MLPVSGVWTPESTLTSVDLPAPLSPTMATTSPRPTSRSMSVRAATAPKFLEIPRIESTGPLAAPSGAGAEGRGVAFTGLTSVSPPGGGWKAGGMPSGYGQRWRLDAGPGAT